MQFAGGYFYINKKEIIMTQKEMTDLEEILVKEHMAEAKKKGAKIWNLGWAQEDFVITSKTADGLLESMIDPDTEEVRHEWGR